MAGRKQHYVPQFLLRNFSLREAAGKVSGYRPTERKHLAQMSVRDAAHENNFYGNPQVEDSFAGLEGEASRIIGAAIREEALPSPRSSDHHALLTFTLTQVFRTRAAADETNATADRLARWMMRDVEALVEKAAKYRRVEKASLLEYQPKSGDPARDGVLPRMFKPDVRTHLRLRCVRLTPHGERYDVGDRPIHHRDPELCKVHEWFVKGVRAGNTRSGSSTSS